jgi:cell wall-associated NlpC family hydrolase
MLPATFASYAVQISGSTPNIYNPQDEMYAAANMLCSDSGGGPNINQALWQYGFRDTGNYTGPACTRDGSAAVNSPSWVIVCANSDEAQAKSSSAGIIPAGALGVFVSSAMAQIGKPYVWGGQSTAAGFDCSGLVDWAASQAGGLGLTNLGTDGSHGATSEDLYAQTKSKTVTGPLQPGDLIFYYNLDGDNAVDHVGIYVGNGNMVDASSPGTPISVQPYDYPGFLAATRL